MGWERFTDAVVRALSEREEGVVYMLWGSYAQKKRRSLTPREIALRRRPPLAAVGLPWIFLVPPLLAGKRIPGLNGRVTYRLVDRSITIYSA